MSAFGRFNCSICFGWLENSQDKAVTDCGHIFHEECIRSCLKNRSGCPSCRQDVNDLKRVIFSARPFDEKTEVTELKEELERAYNTANALKIKNEELILENEALRQHVHEPSTGLQYNNLRIGLLVLCLLASLFSTLMQYLHMNRLQQLQDVGDMGNYSSGVANSSFGFSS
uniref:RING-type domain-containing protein n=1 Tax=Steinernema glaseri TaxID=37863 RepID=A0A1I8A8Z9_9BILA